MALSLLRQELATPYDSFADVSDSGSLSELGKEDEVEVLNFLSERPIHTVFMTSLIRKGRPTHMLFTRDVRIIFDNVRIWMYPLDSRRLRGAMP